MMRPYFCWTMCCCAARLHRNAPLRWTFITVSQSSSLILKSRLSRSTPALFTRMSSRPNRSTPCATAASTASWLDTSQETASACEPACSIWAATCLQFSRSTSARITCAPSSAKRRAVAAPIPLPAPVIKATRPSSFPIHSVSFFSDSSKHHGSVFCEQTTSPGPTEPRRDRGLVLPLYQDIERLNEWAFDQQWIDFERPKLWTKRQRQCADAINDLANGLEVYAFLTTRATQQRRTAQFAEHLYDLFASY